MKRKWRVRVLSVLMALMMVAPLMEAVADTISTNGAMVPTFWTMDFNDPTGASTRFGPRDVSPPVNGWYQVSTAQGEVYIRADSVVDVNATPTPTPPPATPTPVPGAPTPTPTPEVIPGEKDPNYAGTILKYTIPAGGLSLYNKVGGTVQLSAKAGTVINLSTVYDENGLEVNGWYSCYYNGKTYYVPESILTYETGGNQTNYNTQSVVIDAKQQDGITTDDAGAVLYSDMGLTKPTSNRLANGKRVNARYATANAFSYTIGSNTYYFRRIDIKTGSESSSTVTSNTDTNLMTQMQVSAGKYLYRSKDDSSYDYYILPQTVTLYGVKVDSNWYKVSYSSEIFYLKVSDITGTPTQVAVNDTVTGDTYYITIGSAVAELFTRPENTANAKSGKTLSPGQRVLASPYNGVFYSYVTYSDNGTPTTYYILATAVADSTNTSANSSYKILLIAGTGMYDRMTATEPALTLQNTDYYVVNSVNNSWYSIVYNNVTYYVKKAAISSTKKVTIPAGRLLVAYYPGDPDNPQYIPNGISTKDTVIYVTQLSDPIWYETTYGGTVYHTKLVSTDGTDATDLDAVSIDEVTPIANVKDGAQRLIVIGLSAAPLFKDSGCNTLANITLQAGEKLWATKYTDSIYMVNSNGVNYYLPVRYIATVSGGDDASAVQPTPEESASDVAKGETNSGFTQTVISYTIPSGGSVWLYNSPDYDARSSISLNSGTVKLNQYDLDGKWYTTWYSGVQYFVPAASLKVDSTAQVGTFSIKLSADVFLYTSPTTRTKAGETHLLDDAYKTSNKLLQGARINVRIQSYLNSSELSAFGYGNMEKVAKVYATEYNGRTYYFQGFSGTKGGSYADLDSAMQALVASNTQANLITKITIKNQSAWLYAKADTSSSRKSIPVGETVYGISYNTNWYKVIYNDASWYLQKTPSNQETEQITVANEATSTTYTVVIGEKGASLYITPSTNTYKYTDSSNITHEIGTDNLFASHSLKSGETVSASIVNGSWYSYTYNGLILYFQNNVVANANTNASITSYRIALSGTESIPLYSTISSTSTKTTLSLVGSDASVPNYYTLRTVNKEWSSTVYGGKTYYVKNAEIPTKVKEASTPIATTSVGNTYTITLGEGADVYSASSLSGTKIGTLSPGHTTTGTKMLGTGNKMVYKISLSNGSTGYIDASLVTGVKSGDEVKEAEEAGKGSGSGGGSSVAVGTSLMKKLNAGTLLYNSKNTTSTPTVLPSLLELYITKVDADWYSVDYDGIKYIPAAVAEAGGSGSGGTNVSVGDTVSYTFKALTYAFKTPDTSIAPAKAIQEGQSLTLKKVSDSWYEFQDNGVPLYIKASDVTITSTTPPAGGTTDGTGIITKKIMISPASGTVNLRKSASTSGSSTILARIPKGTIVDNMGYTVDSNNQVWYQTAWGGKTGYVIGTYVSPVGTADSGTGTSDPTGNIGASMTVNVGTVNVRSGPGTKHSVIGKLTKNQVVSPLDAVTGTDGMTWYKFQYTSSTVAYIRSDYLSGGNVTNELTGNVAIKAGETNLRSGPGETFGVRAKLSRDTIVTITGTGRDSQNNLWYRVTLGNVDGYVLADLVRQLTAKEQSDLSASIISQYTELRSGSKGPEVLALQQQLINTGYMAAGSADGSYGPVTTQAVMAFQRAKGLSVTGVATPAVQAALFNTTNITPGSTASLDWFSSGFSLIKSYPNVSIYDINTGVTWSAKYVNGSNHADVIPASKADAQKLVAASITGSYVRRPVVVTINGSKFAGSMYAVGHGSTNYCSYFSGVMCIHFTGSKTHGSNNVDSDHQKAINDALNWANSN